MINMKTFLGVVLLSALSHVVQAQMAEMIEVRVTNVDVVVTDSKGKPVTGLTKDDFEILEAGKPQTVTNFYEIRDSTMSGADSSVTPAPEVPAEVSQRRIVLFVDNFTIHPLSRNKAFEAVEKSLDSLLRPGDEAMIVLWQGQEQQLAPFTSNREELLSRFRAAAKRSSGGMTLETMRSQIIEHAGQMIADANTPSSRKISHQQAYDLSLGSARSFAEHLYASQKNLILGLERTLTTLAGVEGKKAMIFIGAELADTPGLELFQQIDSMYLQYLREIRPAVMRESGRSLSGALRGVAQRANANGVTMYLVDAVDRSRRGDPTERMVDASAVFFEETNTPMAMATVASITGGISVPGGRNFEQALGTIASDLSSYYSLGYRSPAEGKEQRRFIVKVKKPGLHVRSRSTYVARSSDEEVRDRVIANVFHSAVRNDFPVSIVADKPERMDNNQYKVKLTVTLPSTLTLIPQDNLLTGEFAVYIATGRGDGDLSEVTKAVQPMKFPGDAGAAIEQQKTFTYTATIVVRPGEQVVSVGVADSLAGTSGFARVNIVAQ
jgi:VWFA-related protein